MLKSLLSACEKPFMLILAVMFEMLRNLTNILTGMAEITIKKRYKYCIKRYRHLSERML